MKTLYKSCFLAAVILTLGFFSYHAQAQDKANLSLNLSSEEFKNLPDSTKKELMGLLKKVDGLRLQINSTEEKNGRVITNSFSFDGNQLIAIDSTDSFVIKGGSGAFQTQGANGRFQFGFNQVPPPPPPLDSVNINVGESRIAFIIQNREDLKELEAFDLNLVVESLRSKLDTTLLTEEEQQARAELLEQLNESRIAQFEAQAEQLSAQQRLQEMQQERKNFSFKFDIEEAPKGARSDMEITKPDKEFPREEKPRNHIEDFFFEWGVSQLGTPDQLVGTDEQYAVKPWGSWMIGLNPGGQVRMGKRAYFGYHTGINWFNFKFSDTRTQLTVDDDTQVAAFSEIQDETQTDYLKSKLTVVYLNASLLPMINLSRKPFKRKGANLTRITEEGFRIGLGPYIGYKIDSYTKIVTRTDGDKNRSVDHKDFAINNLRYGVRGVIGFNNMDFFVNYDLNKLFEDNRGPEVNAVAFGVLF